MAQKAKSERDHFVGCFIIYMIREKDPSSCTGSSFFEMRSEFNVLLRCTEA